MHPQPPSWAEREIDAISMNQPKHHHALSFTHANNSPHLIVVLAALALATSSSYDQNWV